MGSDSEQTSLHEFQRQGAEAVGRDLKPSGDFGQNKGTGPGYFYTASASPSGPHGTVTVSVPVPVPLACKMFPASRIHFCTVVAPSQPWFFVCFGFWFFCGVFFFSI